MTMTNPTRYGITNLVGLTLVLAFAALAMPASPWRFAEPASALVCVGYGNGGGQVNNTTTNQCVAPDVGVANGQAEQCVVGFAVGGVTVENHCVRYD